MLEPKHSFLSIRQQCEIIGINRSNIYYVPKPIDEETLLLMRVVDEIYTQYPFFGTRQMSSYLRLRKGFLYLMAIIDWYSRYVLDWELSITLEADFCIETLARVLKNKVCEIFNTGQGTQFTSAGFTGLLAASGIKISMDGKGRALDNVFVERLWRSVKYEKMYLQEWNTVREVRQALVEYFRFYNNKRPHQGLGGKTPASVYLAIR